MRTSRPAHGNRPAARLVTAMLVALILAVLTAGPAPWRRRPRSRPSSGKNPVFVDPDAPIKVDANALLEQVRGGRTPIFIAVLPDEARDRDQRQHQRAGEEDRRRAERSGGTYMVTAGPRTPRPARDADPG